MDVATAERLAADEGLVRLPLGTPGIERRRRGRGFTYRDPAGRTLSGRERERIETLAIPPAWSDVWIASRDDSHVLARGVDDAGRTQYVYHPRWREAADRLKFARLGAFGESLGRLRRRVVQDIGSDDTRIARCAVLIRLVDLSLIRPGSRCYAEQNGSFGATTLLASQVHVNGTTVRLEFPGKGGSEFDLCLRDRVLATELRRLLDSASDDTHLFVDDDGRPIERDHVNEYLEQHAGPFTVKDFRTWGATSEVVSRLAIVDDEDPDAAIRDAIAETAEALGNTPAVCRQSYVAPAVLDAHLDGRLREAWRRSRASRWSTRPERAALRLLTEEPTRGWSPVRSNGQTSDG